MPITRVDPGTGVNHTPAVTKRTGSTAPKHKVAQKRPKNSTASKHKAQGQGAHRADTPPFNYGPADRWPDMAHTPKFRFVVVKGSGEIVELDGVESCTWDDASAILTGTLELRDMLFLADGKTPTVDQGDRVICEVDEGAGFGELWIMRVYRPELLSAQTGARSFELVSDLDLLRQSEDWFRYKSNKKHPHGWYGHDIIRDVCRRFNVPIGGIYTSSKRYQIVIKRGSPLEVIRNVVLKERRKSGRRLVVRFEHGRLFVVPLQRSAHLLALGPTLMDAAMKSQLPTEFGSAVTVRGIVDDGSQGGLFTYAGGQKAHSYLESAASMARFGYVHRIFFSPDARTDADLAREAKAFLSAVAKPIKTLTLTHSGMPHIRRGDAIQVAIGSEDVRKQVVWVYEVQHSLVAGNYQMTVTVIFDDPFVPKRQKIYFKLKATQDEAIGNRFRLNPTWFVPKANKDDIYGGKPSPQSAIFDAKVSGTVPR